MSTKYQKLCFAKLYHKAPYILFELTVFFYLCYVGEGGVPPPKKIPSSFVFRFLASLPSEKMAGTSKLIGLEIFLVGERGWWGWGRPSRKKDPIIFCI